MKIALGLPIAAPPEELPEWAKWAEYYGFSTVCLLDRLVYDNPEPLITLSALAGATSRIRLQTNILLAPLRETALLTKQAATLDRLTGGRLSLGVGVGIRKDDYTAVGQDFHRRGARLDEQLAAMRATWSGEPSRSGEPFAGPAPIGGGPELLIGGFKPATHRRIARFGDGYISSGPTAAVAEQQFRSVEKEWRNEGREGRPRFLAQVDFALGDEAELATGRQNMRAYYEAVQPYTDQIVNGLVVDVAELRETARSYADVGVDELVLYSWGHKLSAMDPLVALVAECQAW
ncbi:LLM class flavin-dependent oxidoreductase [Actinomadura sp. 3N508]|uniref:LLM class flavin-dependent oxidoreductase n=1 Tax=Actinomadura sp. 3N508 TaxID=3375153 RepID=UPI0037AA1800